MSVLHEALEEYLAIRRSVGVHLRVSAGLLHRFVA